MLKSCCIFFLAFLFLHSKDSSNLAPNAGFEEKGKFWQSQLQIDGKHAGNPDVWDNRIIRSGKYALHLSAAKPGEKIQAVSDDFECTGLLPFSLWIKTQNIASTPQKGWIVVRLDIRDANNIPLKTKDGYPGHTLFYFDPKKIPATSDWTEYKGGISLEKEVIKGKLVFQMNNFTGDIWLDDITLAAQQKNDDAGKTGGAFDAELLRLQVTGKNANSLNLLYGAYSNTPLVIHDVELAGKIELQDSRFSDKLSRLDIQGPDLLVNGEYRLLTCWGALSSDVWHAKMLGMDYFPFWAYGRDTLERCKKEGEQVNVSWGEQSRSDVVEIERILGLGLWPFVFFYENKHSTPFNKFAPDRIVNSHYWLFCQEDPEMQRVRYNSWKAVTRIARNYPVLFYNLNNETAYMDYCIWNIRTFRKQMEKKYPNITAANKIWETEFATFNDVIPSLNFGSVLRPTKADFQKGYSEMLWLDWVKFTEKRFAETINEQKQYLLSIEPRARIAMKSPYMMQYGPQGIYPPLKAAYEDISCPEISCHYIPQYQGEEDETEIKSMLQTPLLWDVSCNAARDKPIIADESSPFIVEKMPGKNARIIELHGREWKFRGSSESLDDNFATPDQGLEEKWYSPDYDDSSWAEINVPDIWGTQGFRDVTIGWYRRTFSLPPQITSIYISGSEFADKAAVYVNGIHVKTTQDYKETFSIDITKQILPGRKNIIAVRIFNKYKNGGYVWGGIRKYITLTEIPMSASKLSRGQMRSHYWTAVVHGASGISIFNYPKVLDNYSIEAMRIIPYVKKEIETAAPVFMPRPRIIGKIAVLYPYETLRAYMPENFSEWKKQHDFNDFMTWYAGALLTGIPVNIVRSDELSAEFLKQYPVLIIRGQKRVMPGTGEILEQYISAGGILVCSADSFFIDDESNREISFPGFFGAKRGKVIEKGEILSFEKKILPDLQAGISSAGKYGMRLIPEGAQIRCALPDGSPALVKNTCGRGAVYLLGAELETKNISLLLQTICTGAGIKADCLISPEQPGTLAYTEQQVFRRNGRLIVYIHNWGAAGRGKLLLPGLDNGEYNVRDVESGHNIQLNGSVKIQGSVIAASGIPLLFASQTPHILLLEKIGTPQLAVKKISPAHEKLMQTIWKKGPESKFKIYMDIRSQQNGDKRTCQNILMPTAIALLQKSGFEIDMGIGKISDSLEYEDFTDVKKNRRLSEYTVLFFPSPADMSGDYSAEECKKILDYVKNGGSAFITGMDNYGIHTVSSRSDKLAQPFGLRVPTRSLRDEKNNIMGDPRFITFRNFLPGHALVKFVSVFQSMGSTYIDTENTEIERIITSNPETGENKPVLVTMNYGKGKLAVMGESSWMWPEWLEKEDNAQLMLNIFNWLSGRNIEKIDRNALKEIINSSL